jgi:hypothetical protein
MLEKSREGATKGNIGAIRSAVSIYSGDWQGVWPSFLETAGATAATPSQPNDGWFSDGTKGSYMDNIPGVKVTGKNSYNSSPQPADGNGLTYGPFGTSQTASSRGWLYESATGYVWVSNTQFDSFGKSYTLFGYQ